MAAQGSESKEERNLRLKRERDAFQELRRISEKRGDLTDAEQLTLDEHHMMSYDLKTISKHRNFEKELNEVRAWNKANENLPPNNRPPMKPEPIRDNRYRTPAEQRRLDEWYEKMEKRFPGGYVPPSVPVTRIEMPDDLKKMRGLKNYLQEVDDVRAWNKAGRLPMKPEPIWNELYRTADEQRRLDEWDREVEKRFPGGYVPPSVHIRGVTLPRSLYDPDGTRMIENPDSPGYQVTIGDDIRFLEGKCAEMCNSDRRFFPGSQPVTFRMRHLDILRDEPFMVAEKSNGTRYLLMTLKFPNRGCNAWLVDRNFTFFPVPGFYPDDLAQVVKHENIGNCVFDCELVRTHNEKGEPTTMLFVFDVIHHRGQYVGLLPFSRRLLLLTGTIRMVAETLRAFYTIPEILGHTPVIRPRFITTVKPTYDKRDVGYLLDTAIPKLPKGTNDGLIFTRSDRPYTSGTCEDILKWKPRELNSVDFLLSVKEMDGQRRYVRISCNNVSMDASYKDKHWGYVYIDPETNMDLLKRYKGNDIVAEFIWSTDWTDVYSPLRERPWTSWSDVKTKEHSAAWKFLKVREDKKRSNYEGVINDIIASISENITSTLIINTVKLGSMLPSTTSEMVCLHCGLAPRFSQVL